MKKRETTKAERRVCGPKAFLLAPLALAMSGAQAALLGGTLDLTTIPKYVTPLVIPPVMNKAPGATTNDYDIAVRQFKQQILPGGIWNVVNGRTDAFPATPVWSYGPDADEMPDATGFNALRPEGAPLIEVGIAPAANSQFNYPAYTIENFSYQSTTVDWINQLVQDPVACKASATPATDPACNYLPHLLPVDRSLHWANPEQLPCIEIGKTKDCAPDPKNGAILQQPYDGPVPMVVHVHGAHAGPESDGYPEAWWLPNANNIPPGYATTGTMVNQFATPTNNAPGVGSYSYPNSQPSSTVWYHDHALGMTRSNVYAGPAGFYIMRDATATGGETGLAPLDANGQAQVLPGPAPVYGEDLAATNLPAALGGSREKYREIPIAIQDRSFNDDGSLFYPDNRAFFEGLAPADLQMPFIGDATPSDIAAIWNPEAFFNTMVVNGVTWPTLEVEPDLYRFRLLNGCNSRFLNLSLQALDDDGAVIGEVPFYQIGAEQSLLPDVVKIVRGGRAVLPGDGNNAPLTSAPLPDLTLAAPEETVPGLLMGNAERADVIVDFSALPTGTTRVRMINTGPDEPFGGFPLPAADPATTGQVMEFLIVADTAAGEGFTAPEDLVLNPVEGVDTYPAGRTNVVETPRDLALIEEESLLICVNIDAVSGAISQDPTATPDPINPGTCVLTGTATLADSVPFAPKAAVLGVNGKSAAPKITLWSDPIETNPLYDAANNPATETWEFWNYTADAHPIHVHEVKFKVLDREVFDPVTGALVAGTLREPELTETGWKDTVITYPGEVTRIVSTLDLKGLYVWHCHIVEHEDNEMMVPYCIGNMDPAKGPIANGCQTLLPDVLYLSADAGGTLTGLGPNGSDLVYADEDILSWNGANYKMLFDGSAAGLPASADISAFDIDHANNRILMSFRSTLYLPGISYVTGSDIVAYDLVKKTFSVVFDGSDVGLTRTTELVDAIEFLPDGRLVVSTNGSTSVPSGSVVPLYAVDQDLLVFTPATLGTNTKGTWAVYFDGSDVGLATAGEGVNGVTVATNGDIYLSTIGSFAVPGLSGQNEDVFVCKTPTTGPATSCAGGFSLFFDGTAHGLGPNILGAIDLP